MTHLRQRKPVGSLARRSFLQGAVALGAFGSSARALAQAPAEVWEEGDPQCRVIVKEVAPAYQLDDAMLDGFMQASRALTGVEALDRTLGSAYLERIAVHPQLTTQLPQLIQTYKTMAADGNRPSEADLQQRIMQDQNLRPIAEQIIYVWYVSAFFLPRDDDPTKNVWVYGSREQYEKSVLWSVIRAHPPMTRGGPFGYWADAPSL